MSEMIYGIHAVQALLERAPERFQEVFILKGREDKRLLPLIHALVPVWPYLQPNRTWINRKAIADVRRMVHIAGEQGMDPWAATCCSTSAPTPPDASPNCSVSASRAWPTGWT